MTTQEGKREMCVNTEQSMYLSRLRFPKAPGSPLQQDDLTPERSAGVRPKMWFLSSWSDDGEHRYQTRMLSEHGLRSISAQRTQAFADTGLSATAPKGVCKGEGAEEKFSAHLTSGLVMPPQL